jgi:hypothetical protein
VVGIPEQRWGDPPSGVPIYKMGSGAVTDQPLPVKRTQPTPKAAEAVRFLRKRWALASLQLKADVATLAVFAGTATAVSMYFDPFFVFGLTLIFRMLLYLGFSLYLEEGGREYRVAARTLALTNMCAFVSATVTLCQSDAIWRTGCYAFIVVALTMEVFGVRTWWTWWAIHDHETGDPPFKPKSGHLLAVFVLILTEFVALLIAGIPLLDEIILFTYHAGLWMIAHPILAILIITAVVVLVVVTKVYVVFIWVFSNPWILLVIMVVVGIIGIATRLGGVLG